MIDIRIQILSFIFSFIYGCIITILFNYFKSFFYKCSKLLNFSNTLIFSIIVTLIYYKINYSINYGEISVYYIFVFFFSMIIVKNIYRKKCKKMS